MSGAYWKPLIKQKAPYMSDLQKAVVDANKRFAGYQTFQVIVSDQGYTLTGVYATGESWADGKAISELAVIRKLEKLDPSDPLVDFQDV
jgi:hypothetical protein